jgi:transposase
MVAARLGNKANRNRFAGTFWYHTPDDPDDDQAWFGLNTVLKNYEQTPPDRPWSAEVEDFRAVAKRVDAVRAERAEVYRAINRRSRMDGQLASLRRTVASAGRRVGKARTRRDTAVDAERKHAAEAERIALARQAEAEQRARNHEAHAERLVRQGEVVIERVVNGRKADAERSVRSWEAEMPRRWQFRADYRETRPGLWRQVRTFGAARRQWAQHDDWLTGQLNEAQEELGRARKELTAAQHEIDTARREVATAQQELVEARHVLTVGVPKPVVEHEPLVAARWWPISRSPNGTGRCGNAGSTRNCSTTSPRSTPPRVASTACSRSLTHRAPSSGTCSASPVTGSGCNRFGTCWRRPPWSGKKINGRKRHIAVGVEGFLLAVVVTAANIGDRMGAKLLVIAVLNVCTRLKLVWADSGYDGAPLARWIRSVADATLQIIKRTEQHTFRVVPRRWVVERSFGWLLRYRRLVRDYERHTEHHEAMVYWATVLLMTRRLARRRSDPPTVQRWGQPRTVASEPDPAPT